MGIYSTGKIFGVRMYYWNDDDEEGFSEVLEKTYETEMTKEQKQEIISFVCNLQENVKNKLKIQYYTEIWSTLTFDDNTLSKMWFVIHQYSDFITLFSE